MSNTFIIVGCPHCCQLIEIVALKCKIFRCGVYKKSNKQIKPHLNKSDCDKLIKSKLIYGCGTPFRVILDNDIYRTEVCDYL